MLSIKNYQKKYIASKEPVLLISDYELTPGTYWLKGENGSGKTSLMKSIAGLIPFEGNISVNGIDMNTNRMAYTKIVNYAEAEPKYPPFLSGNDLVDFYRSTKQGNFPQVLLEHLGVHTFMHQKIATYSSGMIKKLSLVLAFTGMPALILLDEPLVALDVAAVGRLQAAIQEYHQSGVSFLITSHQQLDHELTAGTTPLLLQDKTIRKENL